MSVFKKDIRKLVLLCICGLGSGFSLSSYAASTDKSATQMTSADAFECMIEPMQVIEVRSPIVGILHQLKVRRGSRIHKGQVLAVLESSVEQSAANNAKFKANAQGALVTAQRKLTAATMKAKRLEQLFAENFVSAQAKDDAVNERQVAEAELHVVNDNGQEAKLEYNQMNDELNRRIIHSPFNGVVIEQSLFPGALVGPSEGKKPIMKIAQTDQLEVTAVLPFRFFRQVHKGSHITITPEPPFSNPVKSIIQIVDPVIEATSGTFGVVARIKNDHLDFPSGIRCKMQIDK
jgi:RND family efflux transporter MFP subunit